MQKKTVKLTLSAVFMALGMVLPFLTGQVPQIGSMLLPMHLPVFLCGLICGWKYGAVVGLVLPMLRAAVFGMPPMYPTAIAMALELLTYGLVSGLVYSRGDQHVLKVYGALIAAMVSGRVVWGISQMVLLGIRGNAFTLQAFLSGALLSAIPGIVLQLILIPVIMVALDKSGIIRFRKTVKAAG